MGSKQRIGVQVMLRSHFHIPVPRAGLPFPVPRFGNIEMSNPALLAPGNSRHLAMLPLVLPPNDV